MQPRYDISNNLPLANVCFSTMIGPGNRAQGEVGSHEAHGFHVLALVVIRGQTHGASRTLQSICMISASSLQTPELRADNSIENSTLACRT